MIRVARSRSLVLRGCTFTIRLPYTYPRRIITAVLIMFNTSLVAVPAFMRVDPAITSGPTSGVIAIRARRASGESGVQLIPMVNAPKLVCRFHRAQHIRRAAAGGDSDQRVFAGEPSIGKIAPACFRIVFRSLGGPRQRRFAAGDDALHQLRRDLKRRRTFGGVQNAQPAAGPGPDIEQPPAGAQPLHDPIHGFGNLRNLGRHRAGHLLIFLIDDGEHLAGWQGVNVVGGGIRLLGQEPVEVH